MSAGDGPIGRHGEVVRSEEEVELGTRVTPRAERVRLRKVVVEDEVTQTVPVRKEVVQARDRPAARGDDRVRRGRRRSAVLSAAARYLPPLALMALIFALSAQPNLNSGLGVWDTVLRKLAHMAAFGLLWLLWERALRRPFAALAIALAYAVSDEIHQSFVAGRHGSPWDVAIDAAGIGLAVLAWWRYSQPRSVA